MLGRIWAKQGVGEQVWFVSHTVGESSTDDGVATPGKVCNFFPLLSLETAFPALKLTQSFYLIMSNSFVWKLAIQ